MPKSIYSGAKGTEFTYDVNNSRITQIAVNGNNITKKLYIGGIEQEETVTNPSAASTNWIFEHKLTRIFVSSPSGVIGIYEQSDDDTVTRKYLHTDYLDSVVAVTADRNGDYVQILGEYSFDAWGKRRNASTWAAINDQSVIAGLQTDRGFTGHEMLDIVGLIHMNGRIYDANLGRFLSADPYIHFPGNLQDYNRYSYVGNNPLKFTDPSGYGWLSKTWKKIKNSVSKYWKTVVVAVIAVVATVLTAGALGPAMVAAFGTFWGAVATGAAAGIVAGFSAGFYGSLLYGGSLSDALRSGVTGALWGGIGGAAGMYIQALKWIELCKALAQGVTGAAISFAQGGTLESGFLAGFAGGLVPQNISFSKRVFISAVVGGTASVVGGGKFECGAITAAFATMIVSSLSNYLTEKGEPVFADGAPQNPGAYGEGTKILTNGIGGGPLQSKINELYKSYPIVGFFNPSQGFIGDILQSAWQKLLFGVGDSLAKSLGEFAGNFNNPLIIGHSQGGLTVANAALHGGFSSGTTIQYRSSAASWLRGEFSGRIHGINPSHFTPSGDIISIIAPNPIKAITAPYDIFTGGSVHRGTFYEK